MKHPIARFGMQLSILLAVLLAPRAASAADTTDEERASGLACGPNLTCDAATQYCSVVKGGPVGVPPAYACMPAPKRCPSPPTCECVSGDGIGRACTVSDGGVTVTETAP